MFYDGKLANDYLDLLHFLLAPPGSYKGIDSILVTWSVVMGQTLLYSESIICLPAPESKATESRTMMVIA